MSIPTNSLGLSSAEKEVSLQPTGPALSTRYSRIPGSYSPIQNEGTYIPAQTRLSRLNEGKGQLPHGWDEFVHPEGDVFYYHSINHIMTSADPRNTQVNATLLSAFSQLRNSMGTLDLTGLEIYLECDQQQASAPTQSRVSYYFVDHRCRQLFWVDEIRNADVGLPDCRSLGALKSALTPEYWTHVDYYPRPNDFIRPAEQELLCILRHGAVDDLTSPGSTSPYSSEECVKHLNIIDGFQGCEGYSSYRVACIARLWSAIARARHINMYGMDSPRLDRLQNLPEYMKSQQGTSSFISTMEVLVFFLNVAIHNRLMNLFNARVVYQRHWRTFFNDMRLAWAKMRTIGIVILAADVLLIASGKSIYFTAASASLAGASVYSSVYLHQKHPEYQLATGPDISVYVMSVENYYYGLRPLSIILTLPHALVIYAAVFLHTALLFIVLKEVTGIDQTILAFGSLWVGAAPIVATAYFFAEPAAHAQAREGRRQCSLFGIFHKLLECASRKPRAVTDRGGGP